MSGEDGNKQMAAVQAQVEEVVEILKQNTTKLEERGEKLDDIAQEANKLEDEAKVFQREVIPACSGFCVF